LIIINSLKQLADEIGCDPAGISKTLFKTTDCGIVFNIVEDGISVCGYAEGADADCIPHVLKYPFASDVFWQAVEEADREGCALFDEWNTPEGEQ
jgi:hypothetical protein